VVRQPSEIDNNFLSTTPFIDNRPITDKKQIISNRSLGCGAHHSPDGAFSACYILIQLSQVNILYMVMMMPQASDRGSQPFLWLEERSA